MTLDKLPSYKQDRQFGIWLPRSGPEAFQYSDGESAEEYVHQAILAAEDLRTGSDTLKTAIRDWPSLCHLSPSRANLLRPLQHLLRGDVLEVGSGCGALTRYLGELGGNVIALEGSRKRAQITASRCRDLTNVTVICDRFSSLDLDQRFDTVLLIGVLEYCQFFESASRPEIALLQRCRNLLKPDGRLILAIENKYGLKYFCGAPEDHLGVPYAGIESRYRADSPITWSRAELLEHLRTAGFPLVSELFPFPDYKLPRVVFSKASLRYGGELGDLLASYGQTTHSAIPFTPNFSEASVWPGLLRAGLLPELANSFLFVGSNVPQDAEDAAFFYSTERLRAYQHEIVFRTGSASIATERRRLNDDPIPSGPAYWEPDSAAFQPGTLYARRCSEIVAGSNWTIDALASWARPLRNYLLSRSRPSPGGGKSSLVLDGSDIDCTPHNIAVDANGNFHWFDREFRWFEDLPLNYVLFRGIYVALARVGSVACTQNVLDLRISAVTRAVLSKLGIELSDQDLWDFLMLESDFHSVVLGARPTPEFLAAKQLEVRPSPVKAQQRQEEPPQELITMEQQIANLQRELNRTSAAYAAAHSMSEQAALAYQEVSALQKNMEKSKSWRLTKPLRLCARLFRARSEE